jgi:hypothetical protein
MTTFDGLDAAAAAYKAVATSSRLSAAQRDYLLALGEVVKTLAPAALAPTPAPTPADGLSLAEAVWLMWGDPQRTDALTPYGLHEAVPEEANPAWDFYIGARGGDTPKAGHFYVPWGQVFAAKGNTRWDARLQVRRLTAFALVNGVWQPIRPGTVDAPMEGALWDSAFRPVGSAPVQDEGDGQGSSVPLNGIAQPGVACWHWWYQGWYPRPALPAGTTAVAQFCQARLTGPDASTARFIASLGSDHWSAADGSSATPLPSYMQPRMRLLSPEWRWLGGHTLTETALRATPPPLPGAG